MKARSASQSARAPLQARFHEIDRSQELKTLTPLLFIKAQTALEHELRRRRDELSLKVRRLKKKLKKHCQVSSQRKAEEQLQSKILELQQGITTAVAEARRACIDLACSIAQDFLDRAIGADRDFLEREIVRGLASLITKYELVITVPAGSGLSAADFPAVRALQPPARIRESGDLRPGTVLLEGAAGKLILDWRSRMTDLRRELLLDAAQP